jgi:hypothetical protein
MQFASVHFSLEPSSSLFAIDPSPSAYVCVCFRCTLVWSTSTHNGVCRTVDSLTQHILVCTIYHLTKLLLTLTSILSGRLVPLLGIAITEFGEIGVEYLVGEVVPLWMSGGYPFIESIGTLVKAVGELIVLMDCLIPYAALIGLSCHNPSFIHFPLTFSIAGSHVSCCPIDD